MSSDEKILFETLYNKYRKVAISCTSPIHMAQRISF